MLIYVSTFSCLIFSFVNFLDFFNDFTCTIVSVTIYKTKLNLLFTCLAKGMSFSAVCKLYCTVVKVSSIVMSTPAEEVNLTMTSWTDFIWCLASCKELFTPSFALLVGYVKYKGQYMIPTFILCK